MRKTRFLIFFGGFVIYLFLLRPVADWISPITTRVEAQTVTAAMQELANSFTALNTFTAGIVVNSVTGLTAAITPNAAGGTDVGSAAKPFANIYLGGSATNNFKFTGTAGQATTVTMPDPLVGTNLVTSPSPVSAVTPTLAPTVAKCGSLILVGQSAGEVVTLPAPVVGCAFNFVITVSNSTNSNEIRTDSGSHFLLGAVEHSADGIAPLTFWADGSSIQAIKMDGAHLGGLAGSWFHVWAISTTVWEITGTNECTSPCTTAFNATP